MLYKDFAVFSIVCLLMVCNIFFLLKLKAQNIQTFCLSQVANTYRLLILTLHAGTMVENHSMWISNPCGAFLCQKRSMKI